jgi:hypothetical protein
VLHILSTKKIIRDLSVKKRQTKNKLMLFISQQREKWGERLRENRRERKRERNLRWFE